MERKYRTWPELLVTSAVLLAAGPALAQSLPVSQQRSVHIHTWVQVLGCPESDSDVADAVAPETFDPWSADFTVTSTVCGGSPVSGRTVLDSSMTAGEVRAAGSVEVWYGQGFQTCCDDPGGEGMSEFRYTFRVLAPVAYSLAASLHERYGTSHEDYPRAWVWLSGPGGFWVGSDTGNADDPREFVSSGVLEAGDYEIWCRASMGGGFTNWYGLDENAAFEVVMSMGSATCPCDWDSDGVLNSADFFAFLDEFFADDGDFNADGVTNSQDFFDFLGCFFAPPGECT